MPLLGRGPPIPETRYEYDGQQAVMILKAAALHIFNSIATEVKQYIKERIVPTHEAHPKLAIAVEILIAALILRMYGRTIGNLLSVGIILAAFHGWVSGHFLRERLLTEGCEKDLHLRYARVVGAVRLRCIIY